MNLIMRLMLKNTSIKWLTQGFFINLKKMNEGPRPRAFITYI